jgi:molybdenum cofactor guanylyltransferase
MGENKAFADFAGSTLLARMLELAHAIATDVRVVGDVEAYSPFAQTIPDIFPGRGPLGGIHAALRSARTNINLVLAVDMPSVEPGFLRYLLEQAVAHPALVTVPLASDRLQPLCAVYRRAFVDRAEKALVDGRNKIDLLFTPDVTHIVTQEEIERLAFPLAMFDNLNTREELERARTRIAKL